MSTEYLSVRLGRRSGLEIHLIITGMSVVF